MSEITSLVTTVFISTISVVHTGEEGSTPPPELKKKMENVWYYNKV